MSSQHFVPKNVMILSNSSASTRMLDAEVLIISIEILKVFGKIFYIFFTPPIFPSGISTTILTNLLQALELN